MNYYDSVLKTIDYYMRDKDLNNAFFINGKWGSGKSYFINNILSKHISKKYDFKIIYISLYGMVSVEEIAKQIYSKLIADSRIKKNRNRNRNPLKRRSIAAEYAKDTAIATAKNLIPMLLAKVYITLPKIEDYWKYITLQKIILIFDDLERSRIDTIELMGYINNFVEEYSIKTIVVGNEEEIKQRFYIDDFIGKVVAVKNLKLPIVEEEGKSKSILFEEHKIIDKIDGGLISTNLNTITKKIEYLFPTYENYDKIKEKLIGYTYEFSPPIRDLFELLVEDEVIKRNLDYIENVYIDRECCNLRTFIFSKHAYIQLSDTVSELDLKNYDEIIDIIVENIFYCSLELKNPTNKLNENPYRVFTTSKKNVPQSVVNEMYGIIKKYLNTFELDFEIFALKLFDFDDLISEYKFEIENSLKKLQTYWLDKDDDYIKSSLNEILEMLKQNTLNIQNYPTLISYIYLYNDIFDKTNINIEEIIKQMLLNIKSCNEKVAQDFGVNLHVSYWPEDKEKMSKQLDELREEIENHNLSIIDQSINSLLKNNNWSEEFLINIRDEKKAGKFANEKNFASLIDVALLSKLIITGSAVDMSNIYQAFKFVYSFSNLKDFFRNDLENLSKLRESLSDGVLQVKSKVLSYSINQFTAFLDEKIIIINGGNNKKNES